MPGTRTPEPEPFEQVTMAQMPSRVEHRDVGGRAEQVARGRPRRLATDPVAAADPSGDLVEVGGEEPLHVVLVVQALVEVVGRRALAASIAATSCSAPLRSPRRSSSPRE